MNVVEYTAENVKGQGHKLGRHCSDRTVAILPLVAMATEWVKQYI